MVRDNGTVSRKLISDVKEALEYLFMPDVYYGVRSVYDILMDSWSRVVFDFDAHDGGISEAKESVKALVSYLELNEIGSNVIFTGRGYQVVLIFKEHVKIDIDALRRELKEVNIDRLDLAVLNANPVARMPYTYNSKAGKLAIPVNPFDFDSEHPEIVYADIGLIQALFPQSVAKESVVARVSVDFTNLNQLPLCIMRMISFLSITGELDHQSRFALATFLLREFGYDSAIRVFSKAGDYTPRITDYQLRHISSRKYFFPKCRRIEELGWCNSRIKCPFRPWLEVYLKEWDSP